MAVTQTERLTRPGLITVRKGNRRAEVSYWAQGQRYIPAFAAALILVIYALIFVWLNNQIVHVGYDISRLHQERNRLVDLNRQYKVELANLTSLDRLEHLAKGELGLVTPSPEQVQVIE